MPVFSVNLFGLKPRSAVKHWHYPFLQFGTDACNCRGKTKHFGRRGDFRDRSNDRPIPPYHSKLKEKAIPKLKTFRLKPWKVKNQLVRKPKYLSGIGQ